MKALIIDIIKWLGLDPVANEILNVIYNAVALFIWLTLGMIGAISARLGNKKLSAWQWLAVIGCGLFTGTISYVVCLYKGVNPLLGGIITSASTTIGRELLTAFLTIDYKGKLTEKFADILMYFANKLKKPEDKP